MSIKLGLKAGWLVLAAAAIAMVVVPAAEATTVTYNFTVDVTSGPLSGQVDNGSFSYDSSSVVDGNIFGEALFTNLYFPFGGVTFNAGTANTRWLNFDSTGDLTAFMFGTNCTYTECVAGTDPNAVQFIMNGTASDPTYPYAFGYNLIGGYGGGGEVTFAPAGVSVPAVPEPGAFGMLGLGVLLIGLFVERRRRMC